MEGLFATLLPVLWYGVLAIATFAYALGDGFDLGLSAIYFFSKEDSERRQLLNSIGPVWDGNEVWLIIMFGGLFAGFPSAYAMLLSVFYLPIWTLVMLYMFRGCSLEFRSKIESRRWKKVWDCVFSFSGVSISFFLGVLAGNLVLGLPISPEMTAPSSAWKLFFRLYPVLCGGLAVATFALHACCFVLMKVTEGLLERVISRFPAVLSMFLVTYAGVVCVTAFSIPQVYGQSFSIGQFKGAPTYPLLVICLLATLICCFIMKGCVGKKHYGRAFLCSSSILLIQLLSLITLVFPDILSSSIDPQYSYTILNAASGEKTLLCLLSIVAIGLPFILVYFVYLYRVFRGKTDFPSIY